MGIRSGGSAMNDRATAPVLERQVRGETIRVEPWGPHAVRVRAWHGRRPDDVPQALLAARAPADGVRALALDDGAHRLENGDLHVHMAANGNLTFTRRDGALLLAEEGWAGSREHADVGGGYLRITQRFTARDGERLYGLGQHTHGRLDQKGMTIDLLQTNSQVSVPLLVSSHGYGMLWNHPGTGRVELGPAATRWVSDQARHVDYWVIAGGPADVLRSYAAATGRPSPFPRWASGLWQSRLRYADADELLAVADGFAERGLPLSVLVIDYFSWTRMGDWRLDPERWPDVPALAAELDRRGVSLVVSVWPTVSPISENVDELRERGLLVRRGADAAELTRFPDFGLDGHEVAMYVYDATNPDARAFLTSKIADNFADHGVRAFWLDASEPEVPPAKIPALTFHAGPGGEVANVYPRDHAQGFFDLLRGRGDDAPLSLARSAWAGSQRYGALLWSGDIDTTWRSLNQQVRAGLNVAMSGIPWWTTDTGGFHGGDPDDPQYRELLVRWFQWMVLSPVLRMHGHRDPRGPFAAGHLGGPNEPWSYGPGVEAILRAQLQLRERLRPYVHRQMDHASETGVPPMRPLFVDFPDDEACWQVEDAYLFGPALLVAPVLEPGARGRSVYLPRGARWADAAGTTEWDGGIWIEAKAPLDLIPVFVRIDPSVDAGSRALAEQALRGGDEAATRAGDGR
jgi:alpha-D-xyloside xylohydrolase